MTLTELVGAEDERVGQATLVDSGLTVVLGLRVCATSLIVFYIRGNALDEKDRKSHVLASVCPRFTANEPATPTPTTPRIRTTARAIISHEVVL